MHLAISRGLSKMIKKLKDCTLQEVSKFYKLKCIDCPLYDSPYFQRDCLVGCIWNDFTDLRHSFEVEVDVEVPDYEQE